VSRSHTCQHGVGLRRKGKNYSSLLLGFQFHTLYNLCVNIILLKWSPYQLMKGLNSHSSSLRALFSVHFLIPTHIGAIICIVHESRSHGQFRSVPRTPTTLTHMTALDRAACSKRPQLKSRICEMLQNLEENWMTRFFWVTFSSRSSLMIKQKKLVGNPGKAVEACQRAHGQILAMVSDQEVDHRTNLGAHGIMSETLDQSFHC
jgi:hypothetical protein